MACGGDEQQAEICTGSETGGFERPVIRDIIGAVRIGRGAFDLGLGSGCQPEQRQREQRPGKQRPRAPRAAVEAGCIVWGAVAPGGAGRLRRGG